MRQSINYKWNLPEASDEIEVEDINVIFIDIDDKLKSHDDELNSIEFPDNLRIISATGAGTVTVDEQGTVTSSMLSKINTTWGIAEFNSIKYPETLPYSDTVYVYVKIYFSEYKLYYDEYHVTDGQGETMAEQAGAVRIGRAHVTSSGEFDDICVVEYTFENEYIGSGTGINMPIRNAICYLLDNMQKLLGGDA